MSQLTDTQPYPGAPGAGAAYLAGIRDVVVLELKQRLRSRGWYIMLAIWFILTGMATWLTWLTWASWNASQAAQRGFSSYTAGTAGPGSMIFEVVLAFVLLFALLVAPALSANAVNGDRAGGTLAILQVTLLQPGQILWGKFFAAWLAALAFLVTSTPFLVIGVVLGGMTPGHVLVALLMLAVEVGIVCAVGVGISALAGRPLFSIVVTYLAVAGLVFGTLISFGAWRRAHAGHCEGQPGAVQRLFTPEAGAGPTGVLLRGAAPGAAGRAHGTRGLAAGHEPLCGGGRRHPLSGPDGAGRLLVSGSD
jgi:ABC-type transport system involved in multi-copper enzyme maturation permease subunit